MHIFICFLATLEVEKCVFALQIIIWSVSWLLTIPIDTTNHFQVCAIIKLDSPTTSRLLDTIKSRRRNKNYCQTCFISIVTLLVTQHANSLLINWFFCTSVSFSRWGNKYLSSIYLLNIDRIKKYVKRPRPIYHLEK